MNQQWLIDHVLETGPDLPRVPGDDASYLSLAEAEAIVDATLDELGKHGDPIEYTYMRGHRKRLIHALSMIPKGDDNRRSLLDVGCYGYMGLWAKVHLGYERVVGIEWHPDTEDAVIERVLQSGEESLTLCSHNFDITLPSWPISEQFDTVLFFEVLEHINEDPMGVMERINMLMRDQATLVMSVPNAISYKVLREFMVGMPPWTYWFYEPDLRHEPRHCFEYTPIVFQSLLLAAGMSINAMRTIYAYSSPETERDTLEVARNIGFETEELGETMIAHATKTRTGVAMRYPDVLYSPEGYYKNIYPRLQKVLEQRIGSRIAGIHQTQASQIASMLEHKLDERSDDPAEKVISLLQIADEHLKPRGAITDRLRDAGEAIRQLIQDRDAQRACAEVLVAKQTSLEDHLTQLLYQSECWMRRESELEEQFTHARSDTERSQRELRDTRTWAERLSSENAQLQAQVNELLFQSDCRLQRESELMEQAAHAQSASAQSQQELGDTKAWAGRLSNENAQLQAQVNELLFACGCYLQQLNDPAHCVRVIRRRRFRWALDRSKSIARKTPVVRSTLRPVYRTAKRYIKRRL